MRGAISILHHLKSMFRDVQQALASGDAGLTRKPTRNAKGDIVKWGDLAADEAVGVYLEEHFPGAVVLLSEEASPREFGSGQPRFTVVLDPVDGSDNFARGVAPVGMAVALIPQSCPISVETVQCALVGDLVTGQMFVAERGSGAFCDDTQIHTGTCSRLDHAMISCEMNHFAVREPGR